MAGFSDLIDDVDAAVMASLADVVGTYSDPETGRVHTDIELIIDHDLSATGPEGFLLADSVGITWRRSALACAARGGVFTVCGVRYIVEKVIADDGHMATAACMEDE